ncbi:alpha/beta fold hydrolase [uncultured Ruegeria sp.]|uniref:alpha/beta hydrolase n=1 Tax=uncultured Ruegeria sp. TaxID=259304 RepID=UPI00262314BF|nr:alpha/beta fold hydrolase [uncultured Ruegeria sp.]
MVKLFLSNILVLTLLAFPRILAAQSAPEGAENIIEVDVPAPSLAGNLLGTPSVQSVAIYLPPSYSNQPDHRFPVMYLLHGIFDDYGVWVENFEVPVILDRMISNGELPEMIVVMPNGGNKYGGGYYRNSSVSGNWADYVADDLVKYVDENWRTLSHPESRAIVGHSMGGYGALNLAMTRPGVFSVIWALSPCCLTPKQDLSFGNDAWRRASEIENPGDIDNLLDERDFYPIAILGIVTAFSPDPNAEPVFGGFPFEIIQGEIVLNGESFDAYVDEFPVRHVRDAREALRDLRGLGMGVGLGDQFLHIPTGTLEFSQRLGAERIPHQLDVYAGDHRQLIASRLEQIVFPWVVERLVFSE